MNKTLYKDFYLYLSYINTNTFLEEILEKYYENENLLLYEIYDDTYTIINNILSFHQIDYLYDDYSKDNFRDILEKIRKEILYLDKSKSYINSYIKSYYYVEYKKYLKEKGDKIWII